jgi:hypothetical protein
MRGILPFGEDPVSSLIVRTSVKEQNAFRSGSAMWRNTGSVASVSESAGILFTICSDDRTCAAGTFQIPLRSSRLDRHRLRRVRPFSCNAPPADL